MVKICKEITINSYNPNQKHKANKNKRIAYKIKRLVIKMYDV